ncbi:hypothetical protein [Nocardioides sp. GY 10127]|uniref:hypothetical protein n=1 Tax=Nocardioides sp. GY 10127 TaxID=2569762 RepID=UPI0010A7B80B|nr:hypothetical protein [Nocardioides sp. GY 10127]TIC79447.1 hypothetical protein E8D37_17910 [Nocardioides sp. GY 10127]
MKKLIVGLLMAVLMSAGFVATTATTANAACPYTNCKATKTHVVSAKSPKAGKLVVKAKVTSAAKAKIVGKLVITITKGGKTKKKTVAYTGSAKTVSWTGLAKGKWKVTVTFTPKSGSVYKSSSASKTVTVKAKKKKGRG